MTKKWFFSAVAAALPVLCGCLRMDYVGQTFPELPPGKTVMIYNLKTPVPAGEYRVIGRGDIAVPDRYGSVELREKLEEYARERGASAVKMVRLDKVAASHYYAPMSESERASLSSPGMTGVLARSPDGSPLGFNSFDRAVEPRQNMETVYKQRLKVLFLMTNGEYDRAVSSRRAVPEGDRSGQETPSEPDSGAVR